MRTFEDKPAVRERVPALVGLVGPSGTGKTYSALRLATGMQAVLGGAIFVADTEAHRATHYADEFEFRHIPFEPPFGPLDYLALLQHCKKQGAGVVIVDSMSHEHEGQGGVLEMHESELTRIAGHDYKKRENCKYLAWGKPKQERRQLVNVIQQSGVSLILNFRAKEKILFVQGEKPKPLGYMPIGGEEYVYELGLRALLKPGCEGKPDWSPKEIGEKEVVKLPKQFKNFEKEGQLSEAHGRQIALWSLGDEAVSDERCARVVDSLSVAATKRDVENILKGERSLSWSDEQKQSLAKAKETRIQQLSEGASNG